MKKMKKSNLDEMQELALLKIARNGCWFAFWGLLAAMGIQMLLGVPGKAILGSGSYSWRWACTWLPRACTRVSGTAGKSLTENNSLICQKRSAVPVFGTALCRVICYFISRQTSSE